MEPRLAATARGLILGVVLACVWVGSARADELAPEARRHFERGLALYEKGDYAEAIDALQIAYEIDPHRNVIYAWAQAERLGGDCLRAIELYEEFQDSGVSEAQASAARVNIERCEATLPPDEDDDEDDDADDEPGPSGQVAITAPKPPDDTPWQRDPLVWSLAGGGAVAFAFAGWSYASARAAESDAADPDLDHARYRALRDRSSTRRTLALAATAAGSVAVGLAVWRAVDRDDASERGAEGPRAWAAPDGGGIGWAGTF